MQDVDTRVIDARGIASNLQIPKRLSQRPQVVRGPFTESTRPFAVNRSVRSLRSRLVLTVPSSA